MKQFVLNADLKDDPKLIEEYEFWHKSENGWIEVRNSILESGISDMQIFRTGNRLVMLLETRDDFSFERKAEMDLNNPKVQEWEQLMWKFQQAIPWAKENEKWILMKKIFQL